MAEPAEFRPEELDRIEDALEGLEFDEAIDDGSPRVAARLQDYRSILAMSREVLASEDAPASVLERVMAEAKAGGESVAVDSVVPTLAEAPSRWHRFVRMFLVPGVALAGTAALVLLIARPTSDSAPSPTAPVAQNEAPAADGTAKAVPAAPSATPTSQTVEGESARAEEQAETALAREAPAPPAEPVQIDDAKKPAPAQPKGGGLMPGASEDEPTVWSTLALGDRTRASGDCETARIHYRRALEDADVQARARAHAGLGFCDAWAGEHVSATEHYDEAKKLNPGITEFIEANRPQGTGGGVKASKSSRKSKAASPKQAAPKSDNAFDEVTKE